MGQWGFYYNQTRCVNCKACIIACKAWNEDKLQIRGESKENWRRVLSTEYGDIPPNVDVVNLSISCNHCNEAVCIDVCPTRRIYKENEFGIVLIDRSKECISCGLCKKACPWGSPQFYDNNLKKYSRNNSIRPKMSKCDLCIERIKNGLKPACVAGCIMRAIDAGPIEELKKKYGDWVDSVETFYCDSKRDLVNKINPNIIFKKKYRRV